MSHQTLIIFFLFLFISCEKEVEFVQIPQRQIPIEFMLEKEISMIEITNDYRALEDLPPYKTSLDLYHFAKDKVYDMAEKDSLSHEGFYGTYVESGALFFGESISYNFITPEANMTAFRNSEYHWPMFVSEIYEYIAIACYNNYTCVLVARYRPYNSNGKREFEIKDITTENLSVKEFKKH